MGKQNLRILVFSVMCCILILLPDAVFADGSNITWHANIGRPVAGVAVSMCSNYIAVGTYARGEEYPSAFVYLFNKRGKKLWEYEIKEKDHIEHLYVSWDGQYVAAAGEYRKKLYFFDKEGNLLWQKELDEYIKALLSPTLDCKRLTVVCKDDISYLFGRDGDLLDKDKMSGSTYILTHCSWDGNYCWDIGKDGYYHYKNLKTGTPRTVFRWLPDGNRTFLISQISPSGTYLFCMTGMRAPEHLYVLRDDGMVLWDRQMDDIYRASVSEEGFVVAGTTEGDLYLISPR